MSDFNITSRYSNALMALAEEKNSFSEVAADIELVFNTLKVSRDLRLMLSSPVIKSVKKIEILKEIFSTRVSQDALNYIVFIVNKKREDLLFKILHRFLQLKDEKLGLININVKSAAEFDNIQMEAMQIKLADYTRKKVKIDFNVEENLIGGFVAKVGDTVIDGSVKQQLKNLKKQLLA